MDFKNASLVCLLVFTALTTVAQYNPGYNLSYTDQRKSPAIETIPGGKWISLSPYFYIGYRRGYALADTDVSNLIASFKKTSLIKLNLSDDAQHTNHELVINLTPAWQVTKNLTKIFGDFLACQLVDYMLHPRFSPTTYVRRRELSPRGNKSTAYECGLVVGATHAYWHKRKARKSIQAVTPELPMESAENPENSEAAVSEETPQVNE